MPQPVIFLVVNFRHFAKYILKKLYILSRIPLILFFGGPKSSQLPTL
jgi:hypothetical protein